jgi:starch synthase (maltosyl-transferring)
VGDVILVVVNLDPTTMQSAWVDVDITAIGVEPDQQYQLLDLLTDRHYVWEGSRNFVQLDPAGIPAHLFSIRKRARPGESLDQLS